MRIAEQAKNHFHLYERDLFWREKKSKKAFPALVLVT